MHKPRHTEKHPEYGRSSEHQCRPRPQLGWSSWADLIHWFSCPLSVTSIRMLNRQSVGSRQLEADWYAQIHLRRLFLISLVPSARYDGHA